MVEALGFVNSADLISNDSLKAICCYQIQDVLAYGGFIHCVSSGDNYG